MADETDDRKRLGHCLRAIRQALGYTLTDVAARTGIALSTLSRVENHQMSLTYDKLLQLSRGLGIEIEELFEQNGKRSADVRPTTSRRSVSRARDGHLIKTGAYTHLYKCTDILAKRMVPIVVDVSARSMEEFGTLVRHPGEEFFFVVEGEVTVVTEYYAAERLGTGDGIYLDSNMGHAYLATGPGPARGLCICSAAFEDLDARLREISNQMAPAG